MRQKEEEEEEEENKNELPWMSLWENSEKVGQESQDRY